MAVAKTKKKEKKQVDIISVFMEHILQHGKKPASVYKFCKESNIEEKDFYQQYGGFEALENKIWVAFHEHAVALMEKQGRDEMTPKDQLLTYYFTLFEILTANRSYILTAVGETVQPQKLSQLKMLRKEIKKFSMELVALGNEQKSSKAFQHPESIFSEAVWLQFLFLFRFWIKDQSPAFEKTDAAIEKSVHTAFDVFETKPLESLVDFGKFLWKEYSL